jgi:hypothetical protein
MKTYTIKELDTMRGVIDQAKEMWQKRCDEYIRRYGDNGTCVLGAGISVYYIPKRCRKAISGRIITQNDVTNAQGSLVWEKSVDEVIGFLKTNGIECFYNPGNMD